MKKRALVTGITGQDGAYLAELLLEEKGYEVHGIVRRSSSPNTERIDAFANDLHLHYGDLTDSASLVRIIKNVAPDEIYNLAAQSHVAVSFENPEFTADVDALGTLRLLEAIRLAGLAQKTRFYQASSSELFGEVREVPQRETTPFYPRSPYAVAKLYAYWITINYRESYGMFAANGILFNHEGPSRGENFVTRKITRGLGRIAVGLQECLFLGNLDARRDWGHAEDYVEAMWRILQHTEPDDFVIASGEQHSVREFVMAAATSLGIGLSFEGTGLQERGIVTSIENSRCDGLTVGQTIVAVDPAFFRPAEVDTLLGDYTKAKTLLGWSPQISFEEMIEEMAIEDLMLAEFEAAAEDCLV